MGRGGCSSRGGGTDLAFTGLIVALVHSDVLGVFFLFPACIAARGAAFASRVLDAEVCRLEGIRNVYTELVMLTTVTFACIEYTSIIIVY